MALFKTSGEAREILEQFRRTGIRPNMWARAALGYSLSLEAEPDMVQLDSEGTEFQDRVLFGDDEEALLALLRQRVGRIPEPSDIGGIIKSHVERGLRHFHSEYQRLNRRGDELLLHLLDVGTASGTQVATLSEQLLPSLPSPGSFLITVPLGVDAKSNVPIEHALNGPGGSPHVAIMGRNGTGKTRTALSILQAVHKSAPHNVPYLIFDYAKGDIAANDAFVSATASDVVLMPGRTIPLAPLSVPASDQHSVQLAARRFRDTVCSVVKGLGAIQKERCLSLVESLHANVGGTPDLNDLAEYAEHEYSANGWSPDSLLACIREFARFPLFRPASEGDAHDVFRRSHIIDVHRLPEDLRKLSVFLLLDRLYSEIMVMSDAPLDSHGNRQVRLIIVIDEAHHYLPCKQQTLENMVREVRSKGVALWLLSQSPDDFDQSRYNFAREMGLAIVFSCVLDKPKMLEAVLGGKVDPKRLSHLSPGVALTRLPGSAAPIEVRTWEA